MASAHSESEHQSSSSAPTSGQLDFYEAMADFRTMFPKLEPDVIEAVLRANNGVVESTIDNLLKLNEGNEDFVPYRDIAKEIPPDLLPPSYDAATSSTPVREEGAAYRNWKPPLLGALPDDFLRLSGSQGGRGNRGGRCRNCGRHHHHHRHHHRHTSTRRQGATPRPVPSNPANIPPLQHVPAGISEMDTVEGLLHRRLMENEMKRRGSAASPRTDADLQQCLDDERMAIMLQNEEFLRMLRRDDEFMRALHSDRVSAMRSQSEDRTDGEKQAESHNPQMPEHSGHEPERPSLVGEIKDDNEELRRQLKHMGKFSKKKFTDLAKRFFTMRYKKKQAPIPFYKTDLPTESTMNLLDDDDTEEREVREEPARRREIINFEPLPGTLPSIPTYRTVQRPMYHPDCITTLHDDSKDMV